jgi:hypothetical protein
MPDVTTHRIAPPETIRTPCRSSAARSSPPWLKPDFVDVKLMLAEAKEPPDVIRARGDQDMTKMRIDGAGLPAAGQIDTAPFGREANRPCLELLVSYAVQQALIPRRRAVDESFGREPRRALFKAERIYSKPPII